MKTGGVVGSLKARGAIERMAPYSPPTGGRADKVRLDFNENTVGCSPAVVAYLKEQISENGLAVYPEYGDTRRELGAFFGVDEAQMALTNGTDEAIQVLVNTYVDNDDDVIVLRPSYAMYRFYAEVAGARIREIDYRAVDLAFPLEELLEAIRPETRAILISNPNNPTGAAVGLDGARRILERAPQAAVLIDEAYYEFYGVTALGELARYPNLFVSRTFSKIYGLAAMRIGCLFSEAGNIAYVRKGQSPYSVNQVAAMAVRAAVRDREYVANYVKEILASRDRIYAGFERLGIKYYPSQANFVLFHAGPRSFEIRDKLRAASVLVRDRSYEIAGCVRVTVGTAEQVERFFSELEKIW